MLRLVWIGLLVRRRKLDDDVLSNACIVFRASMFVEGLCVAWLPCQGLDQWHVVRPG